MAMRGGLSQEKGFEQRVQEICRFMRIELYSIIVKVNYKSRRWHSLQITMLLKYLLVDAVMYCFKYLLVHMKYVKQLTILCYVFTPSWKLRQKSSPLERISLQLGRSMKVCSYWAT